MKKRLIYLAAAAAMMAGCSETDELNLAQAPKAGDGSVSFCIYTNRAVTRAGQAGVINTDSLKKGNGIGVFAYHTNNSRYDERNSLPNFMYNQQVKWNAGVGNGVWEYSPLKYWPNEFGTNAVSEDIDYVTFFAYAPYVAVDPTTGTPEVDYSKFVAKDFAQYLGYDDVADFEEKEGYTDNIAPGEKSQGLNPVLIEEPTTTTWAKKRPGIPTKAYANLFAGAKSASDAVFVIPTNERMTITVIYDVMTRDTLLSQNLSDGFTKGSRVQNKISQTLKDLKLEAGKAYTIKLVVGVESVKMTVDVEPWDVSTADKKVDLPYNPRSRFTISDDGTQAYFSPGNLQYQASTNTWRFAENQWDYVGYSSDSSFGNVYVGGEKCDNNKASSSYEGWIDLFGWGTAGHEFATGYGSAYQPWSTSMTDTDYGPTGFIWSDPREKYSLIGTFAQGDWGTNMDSDWRTPTADEWTYVFDLRTTPSGVRYAKATVNGVKGVILLPDNWNTYYYSLTSTNTRTAKYDTNVISSSDWTDKLESRGAVFLPITYRREGTGDNGSTNGYYWSSSVSDALRAHSVYFSNGGLYTPHGPNNNHDYRHRGCAVRLIHVVE